MKKTISMQNYADRISRTSFLKDVFICSMGAYGGPEAHMSVFMDQMVIKRRYLSEEELVELIALCSILPGPTSTQTIVAIGYKKGGPLLALLTMLVWAAPALMVMTALSFLYAFMVYRNIPSDILRFIGPMAVGFIVLAAFRIGRKVVTDKQTGLLMLIGGVATYFIRAPWIFPLILLFGGLVSILCRGENDIWNRTRLSPQWRYLIIFLLLGGGSFLLAAETDFR